MLWYSIHRKETTKNRQTFIQMLANLQMEKQLKFLVFMLVKSNQGEVIPTIVDPLGHQVELYQVIRIHRHQVSRMKL